MGACGPVGIWALESFGWLPGSSCGVDRDEFVFAGTRAAWTDNATLMPQGGHLDTGTPGSETVELASNDAPDNPLVVFGDLAGDGALLVYDTAKYTYAKNDADHERPVITEHRLWRIVGKGARTKAQLVLSGADAHDVVSVDAGRIAVLRTTARS